MNWKESEHYHSTGSQMNRAQDGTNNNHLEERNKRRDGRVVVGGCHNSVAEH